MKKRFTINFYLLEYSFNALLRQKYKTVFIAIIFTLLTTLLSSVFFITSSIRYELQTTVEALPQIIIQKIKAGRHYDLDVDLVDEFLEIDGVSDAHARVWGYYYFENAGVNFSLVGLEEYAQQYKKSFERVAEKFDLHNSDEASMVVGRGVYESMKKSYYHEYFNFIKPDGSIKKVMIAGVFDGETELESNDMILMSKDLLREIFDLDSSKATDIVIQVANASEIPTIISKIKLKHPDTRVISSKDLEVSYQNIFDYKSGIFLALFIISLFTFFIIVYDKASGLSSTQKREIGILKALGWRVDDILKEKFYEAFFLSFLAYVLGVGISLVYVYMFQAPLLRDIFVGYSQLKTSFELPFVFDFETLFLVFFLSVPIYIAATIIPSWKVATLEADEVIR